MYERFTDQAHMVMQLANQEAQRLNGEYIGTEHVLVGLVKEESGVAARVLKTLGIDLRSVTAEIEKIIKSGSGKKATGKLVPTPRLKRLIEYSIEEARNLNHDYVGTEHLLLGLLREREGVAAQVLMNQWVDFKDVREELFKVLGVDPGLIREPEEEQEDEGRPAWEYDLYVPLRYNDGSAIKEEKINQLKAGLREKFAAVRFSTQRNPGIWNIGYATFRDEIVVCHMFVQEDEDPREFLIKLKEELKSDLKQEDILIVRRKVWVL